MDGRKPTRAELTGIPDNVMEQWVTDDRLSVDEQLPDIFYTRDRQAFDKGHLVRRDDVTWGSGFEDIQMANGDTYYTTNCSPQVEGFNRAASGEFNWGDLENMVQKETKAEKVMLFSGPVLAPQDRLFEGLTDSGRVLVKIPRRFWKIIVARTESGVKAFGFMPKQDLSAVNFGDVEFALPELWKEHLVSIATIEKNLFGLVSLDWFKERDASLALESIDLALRSAKESRPKYESDHSKKRNNFDPYIYLHFEDIKENADDNSGLESYVVTPNRTRMGVEDPWSGSPLGQETVSSPESSYPGYSASPTTQIVTMGSDERRALLESGQIESMRSTKRHSRIPVLIQFRRSGWNREIEGLEKGSWLGRILTAMASAGALAELEKDPEVISVEASRDGGALECAQSMPWIQVPQVHAAPRAQKGGGAIVAILDTGIDVMHHAFRDVANKSRILWIWDQRDDTGPNPSSKLPGVFSQKYGTLHSQSDIDGYITRNSLGWKLGRDPIGHGTHVASIAAGSPVPLANFPGGVAPESDIIVVVPKLSTTAGDPVSLGYSVAHIDALAFIRAAAEHVGKPVSVNVSLGMNAGAHDGTSLLELAFDNFSGGGRDEGYVVIKSAGNEFGHSGHASVTAFNNGVIPIEWRTSSIARVQDYLEFWFPSCDDLRFTLVAPDGGRCSASRDMPMGKCEDVGGTYAVSLMYTRFHPDNGDSLLQVVVRSGQGGALSIGGDWQLEVFGNAVRSLGVIHGWVERDDARAVNFITGSPNALTLSIPSTARTVVAVGACQPSPPLILSPSSSRGPTRDSRCKPELVAPGVSIIAARSGTETGLVAMTGTSMAAPHVTGAVALLLAEQRKPGRRQVNAAQVRAALSQCLRDYTGRWQEGFGHGGLDVDALLRAFD